MNISRIILLALVIFLSNVAIGAIVVLIVGSEDLVHLIAVQYAVGIVVTGCVFAYVAKVTPERPYLTALIIGVLAQLLGVAITELVGGQIVWEPAQLLFDIPALIVALLVGVSAGKRWGRRGSA